MSCPTSDCKWSRRTGGSGDERATEVESGMHATGDVGDWAALDGRSDRDLAPAVIAATLG